MLLFAGLTKNKKAPQQVNGKTVISPWKLLVLPERYFPLKMFCWRIPNKSCCCIADFNRIQKFSFLFVLKLIFRSRDGYRSACLLHQRCNVTHQVTGTKKDSCENPTWLLLQPALPRQWHNLSQGCLGSQSPLDLQLVFWRCSFS